MPETIVLVRHGRSGHGHSGWIDGAGFVRWREAYENAGIDPREVPPDAMRGRSRQVAPSSPRPRVTPAEEKRWSAWTFTRP